MKAEPAASESSVAAEEQPGVDLAGQVQERAQTVSVQARTRAREEVERRSSDLAGRVDTTAKDLRGVAEHLRAQEKDAPARVAEQAAERFSSVRDYLRGSDGEQILHDVEASGRKRPWAVIAGGAAVGLVASRFLNASSSDRYRRVQTGQGRPALPSSAYRDPVLGPPLIPLFGHVPPRTPPGNASGGPAALPTGRTGPSLATPVRVLPPDVSRQSVARNGESSTRARARR